MEHNLVAVTETFLDNSVEDLELSTDDWSILRRDRITPCGGVLLAARAPITLRHHSEFETDCGEDLWASFSWCGRPIYVCVVYIKPSAKDEEYMRWFCKIESFINDLNGIVIILGDINLKSASLNINNYFCYFLSFCGLKEKNIVKNLYGGMLDIVLVQERAEVSDTSVASTEGIVPLDNYHPALDIGVKVDAGHHSDRLESSNINPAKDWNFKKCDYQLLYSLLSTNTWDTVLQSNDVYSATKYFYDSVYNIFDACMPKNRRQTTKGRRYPVWFTFDIIRDTRLKNKLHTSWKRTKSETTYKTFSNLRTNLKIRVAQAYILHLRGIEDSIKFNPRNFWRHIGSLRTKGGFEPNIIYKGKTLTGINAAEAFANYFSSVFLSDKPKLNAEEIAAFNSNCCSNYINIPEISLQDVVNGMSKLKTSSSVGPDNLPPEVLKGGKQSVYVPLHHIFNLALKTGVYPQQWKLSRVTPIPKGMNKKCVEEYRPIAILSSPAKLFEKILHKYIYMQVNKYLCNEQHGFREKRSVNSNLLTLVDFISTRLDRKTQVDVLYFDFSKAFDKINNDILLAKLSALGMPMGLLRFLADYLRDRQQFVRLGIYDSQPYHTRSGVSQGSILGPLLFLLMVNDLPMVLNYAKSLLYADDLKLFAEIRSEADCLLLQRDIDAVYKWSVENKLEFNYGKCQVMSFGRMRSPQNYSYLLNNCLITRTTAMKDLGVIFDSKLTFHPHIVTVAKESFKRLGFVLRNSRDFKNSLVTRLLFSTLVRSKLEASSCVWNPYESTYELLLEKVQKAFLRCLYKRNYGYYPYMYPTNFLLGCLGYNSLQVRRQYDQVTSGCKILRGKVDAPEVHDELCRLFTPDRYHRSRKHQLFAVRSCRTVAGAHSPVPRVLNALNALLDSNPNCDMFADEWSKILSECLKYCEKTV